MDNMELERMHNVYFGKQASKNDRDKRKMKMANLQKSMSNNQSAGPKMQS